GGYVARIGKETANIDFAVAANGDGFDAPAALLPGANALAQGVPAIVPVGHVVQGQLAGAVKAAAQCDAIAGAGNGIHGGVDPLVDAAPGGAIPTGKVGRCDAACRGKIPADIEAIGADVDGQDLGVGGSQIDAAAQRHPIGAVPAG